MPLKYNIILCFLQQNYLFIYFSGVLNKHNFKQLLTSTDVTFLLIISILLLKAIELNIAQVIYH